MPQDETEDVASKDASTLTQNSLEELLKLLREICKKNIHDNLNSSPYYGTSSFAQPHTSPTPDETCPVVHYHCGLSTKYLQYLLLKSITITIRDCHRYKKPQGLNMGLSGVGVQVGHPKPHVNPYPKRCKCRFS